MTEQKQKQKDGFVVVETAAAAASAAKASKATRTTTPAAAAPAAAAPAAAPSLAPPLLPQDFINVATRYSRGLQGALAALAAATRARDAAMKKVEALRGERKRVLAVLRR